VSKRKARPSRRRFLTRSLVGVLGGLALPSGLPADEAEGKSRQATGVKVGEVTDTSAIVWMRLTAQAGHHADGKVLRTVKGEPLPADVKIEELRGACPGAAGVVRLRYGIRLAEAKVTEWIDVTAKTDFMHQFRLNGLKAGTEYHYAAETAGPGGKPVHESLHGRFQTAPVPDQYADVTFTVITCQGYKDLDHADGFHIYPAMAALKPHFFVPTGDNVYYDNDDFPANTVELARHHWHRMHGLPRHVAFHLQTSGYWEKDDHDTLSDDCWPSLKPKKMLPLTFADGRRIFREQVPMGEKTYRTIRWGKALQVWMTEGRDFRSSNNAPDGAEKTIWGKEQKAWLLSTLKESDAEFKVLVSPTPIVGPDRPKKSDNHSNAAFQHEGDDFRQWVKKNLPKDFFVVCGDRHWQYHSVHPQTGLHEFGTGAASDAHAGGSPGEDKNYHRFHRVKGGFVSVAVRRADGRSSIRFCHHDVLGRVVHEHQTTH
jgi:alkaline phosphatase D